MLVKLQVWTKGSRCGESSHCVEAMWTRASRCESSACVELSWVESTRCESQGCVEVAHNVGDMLMRDSKDPDSPILRFPAGVWQEFVAGVKAGEFD